MEKKKPSPSLKLKQISKFITSWRFVAIFVWTYLINALIFNNKVLLIYFCNFGSLPLSVASFFLLRKFLRPIYCGATVLPLIFSSLIYKYVDCTPTSAWGDFSFLFNFTLFVVLILHNFSLKYVFSVSHSRPNIIPTYLPAMITNLFIYMNVFMHESSERFSHNFFISAFNSVIITLYLIYNEDFVYIFNAQKKKRIYEIMEIFPYNFFSSLLWSCLNLVMLTVIYFAIRMLWKEVEISYSYIQSIFYVNVISFFIIRSSCLIFNIISTEKVQFSKLERDLRLPSDDKCETLFAAIKNTDYPLMKYHAWKDLERISFYEPNLHSEFFKDKDSWFRVCGCCLDEIKLFTERMEKYCTSKNKIIQSTQTTFGEDFFFSGKSIIRSIQERREKDQLFADFEVISLAIKIIAKLTVESKTKDSSGILQLQNQHQLILETLNKAYNAMDSYFRIKKKKINYQKSKTLSQEIKAATYMITLAFYQHLGTLSFTTRDTLQPFIDFVA